MALLGLPQDGDDDPLASLKFALSHPDAATHTPSVALSPASDDTPGDVERFISGGLARWAIVPTDDAAGPVHVVVDTGMVGGLSTFTESLQAIDPRVVVNLAGPGPGVFTDLLRGTTTVPLRLSDLPVGDTPPRAWPRTTAGSGVVAQVPDKPPAAPDTSEQTAPAPPAPPGAPNAAGKGGGGAEAQPCCGGADADVVKELAQARRPLPATVEEWASDDDDRVARVADAFLAEQELLNRAIGWHTAPDGQWLEQVPEPDRGGLAAELLRAKHVWSAAPDAHLWALVDPAARGALAVQVLRGRAGLAPTAELEATHVALERQQVALEEQRVAYFTKVVAYTEEYIEQRKKWRTLATSAPRFLGWGLGLSTALSVATLALVALGELDGWQGALIIFVLAVVAVSPSVLLLLERPLAGVDAFQPPGPGGAPAGGGSGGGRGDGGAAGGGAAGGGAEAPGAGNGAAKGA
ncbi:hypothetical protein [Xylanimonas allomyrinae]|uniref:hypothetical protein n=1 Tax=Xylanimonas allomyrinae TaxID=2509459 RepID=UPI0013A61AF3|nr:hypothetical protein [Xylanimonas allomyrinae]